MCRYLGSVRQGGGEVGSPVSEEIVEGAAGGGVLGGEVVLFHLVVGKVEEERNRVGGKREKLPGAFADGRCAVEAPEELLVWRAVLGLSEKGEKVHAIEVARQGKSGRAEESGEHVEGGNGLAIDGAGGDALGPAHQEGDADAAFRQGAFAAADGFLEVPAGEGGAAVVAEENDDGVILEMVEAEGAQEKADAVIHSGH